MVDNTIMRCNSLVAVMFQKSNGLTWAIIVALFIPCNLVANSVLMFALKKTKQLQTISNRFIFIMSLSDICSGIFTLPLLEILILTDFKNECTFAKVVDGAIILFNSFSSLVLMCISVDRFLHIHKPNQYQQVQSEFKMRLWIFCSAMSSIGITSMNAMHPSLPSQIVFLVMTTFYISSMMILYIKMIKILNKRDTTVRGWQTKAGPPSTITKIDGSQQTTKYSQLSAIRTIQVVLIDVCLCYIPFNVTSCILAYYKYGKQDTSNLDLIIAHRWTLVMLLSSSITSSCIIIFGNSKCRRFLLTRLQNKVFAEVVTVKEGRVTNEDV